MIKTKLQIIFPHLNLYKVFLTIFLVGTVSSSAEQYSFDKAVWDLRVKNLASLENTVFKDSVEQLYNELNYSFDKNFRFEQTTKIFQQTKDRNRIVHIWSLVYFARWALDLSLDERLTYFDRAEHFAKSLNLYDHLAWIYDAKSTLYRDYGQYENSMKSIMVAREYFEKIGNDKNLEIVTHQIADLYNHAGLFDAAEEYYLSILNLEEHTEGFVIWRHFTILNNLGEIEMKRGNVEKALTYFTEAEDLKLHGGLTLMDSIGLAYTYCLVAQTYNNKGDFDSALDFYRKGIGVCERENYTDFLPLLYFEKCRAEKGIGNSKIADQYLNKVLNLVQQHHYSQPFLKRVYKIATTLAHDKGDIEKSLLYQKKYIEITDSLTQSSGHTKALLSLVEKEQELTARELEYTRKTSKVLFVVIIIVMIAFLIGLFLVLKLNSTFKKLVHKTLQADGQQTSLTELPHHHLSHTQKQMINDFERNVIKGKRFLLKNITIHNVANELKTEPEFLDKTIWAAFNQHFDEVVDSLRVQESIRFLEGGCASWVTIDSIAEEYGFKTTSDYVVAFKKHTGITPSFFIKNLPQK